MWSQALAGDAVGMLSILPGNAPKVKEPSPGNSNSWNETLNPVFTSFSLSGADHAGQREVPGLGLLGGLHVPRRGLRPSRRSPSFHGTRKTVQGGNNIVN